MKKNLYIVFAAAFIGGCATWIPAKSKDLGDGKYLITAAGNTFASIDKMKEKVIKKAEKQCSGNGFDYEKKPTAESHKNPDYVNGGYQYHTEVSTVIVCKKQ
ncbi:hypothetical protein [Agaribacterium sp. ZY112]|uniref:hypothetical protein n=1 Tax=Agaribacterium sp. ZY112 TaxID=3233574 RepID=UPI003524976F